MVDDRERILAAGCTAYIDKPIAPESFVEELKKFIIKDDDYESPSC